MNRSRMKDNRAARVLRLLVLLMGGGLFMSGCQESPPADGQPRCVTRQAADSAGVGDVLILEAEVRWPASAGAASLVWNPPADTLLLIARDSTLAGLPEDWQGADYELRFLATREGIWTIPPALLIGAEGDTLAAGKPFQLAVGARVPPEETQLRPLAEMISLKRFPYLIAAAAIAGLAVILFALWWWSRRKRAEEETSEIPLPPPDEEFEDRLDELLAAGYAQRGEMRLFTQELSWVLRRYLGRRWEQPAVEATRPEILRWLPQTDLAVGDQQQLAGWLARTDSIKFAGARPVLTETEELTTQARRIVEESESTYAAAHPPEEEEPRAAEAAPEEERA